MPSFIVSPKGLTAKKPPVATLVTGSEFNSALKAMSNYSTATSVEFTRVAIPKDKIASATLVSADDSSIKAYMYANDNGDTIYVSPQKNSANIYANTNCTKMFWGCDKLTTLDLSNFNTSNVTTMRAMFSICSVLTTLDLSNFNTSKVTDMSYMFNNCTAALTALDLSNFNTSKVTNMSSMFSDCSALTTLDISNFDTSNLIDMSSMFNGCSALRASIDITNFDTSDEINMSSMFNGCSTEAAASFSVYCTEKTETLVDNMVATKSSNSNVSKLFISTLVSGRPFNTALKAMSNYSTATTVAFTTTPIPTDKIAEATLISKNGSIANTYMYAADDTTIKVSPEGDDVKIYANTDCARMFWGCDKLTTLDLSNFNTSKVTDMISMFSDCSALTTLDISNFDTSNLTNMSSMFNGCSALTTLDISNFDTSNVINMSSMFNGCSALTTLDLSNFNTSKVTDMISMFNNCTALTTLDISNFDTSKVIKMSYMFYNCSTLRASIDITTTTCTTYSRMFFGCSTNAAASFSVYCTEETESLVNAMIATKSDTSNVTKQLIAA